MKNIINIFLVLALFSCSNSENSTINDQSKDSETTDLIVFTDEQIKIANITTGKIEKREISETIQCTGTISIPPHNIATVSPVISGFVNKLNYFPGNKVQKGAVLATLQHPDFIILQKQYIEAKSRMEYFQEEYKRQGELTVEKAASIKSMQKAKSDYLSSEAEYKSLKSQLHVIGVDTEQIESGDFQTHFKLLAPISGVISQLNANTGKYINTDNYIYEIINDNSLNLDLNVFEKDISKIKVNQAIEFTILNSSKKFNSKVSRIGAKVNKENRTVLVQCNQENKNQELKSGMRIIANILINNKEAFVLPNKAITDNETGSYIFIKKDNGYKPITINKGAEKEGFTELIDVNKEFLTEDIVINGTYYLMSILEIEE